MASVQEDGTDRIESPDPSSHAVNIYDTVDTESEWVDEDGDDDGMDFEPTTDDSEENEFFDSNEEGVEAEFYDAADGLSGVEIEFSMDEAGSELLDDERGNDTETEQSQGQAARPAPAGRGRITVSHTQIMQLLGQAGLRRIFANHTVAGSGDPNMDDDDDILGGGYRGSSGWRRRCTEGDPNRFPKIPSDEGRKLMDNGSFGSSEPWRDVLKKRKSKLARQLMYRELDVDGTHAARANKVISQGLIPSSNADTIIHYNKRCYSGQFSDDGNFFFSCAQDFKVRMYDTSNPYKWKYYKTVVYPYGQWTITDATLSPDNRYLAYSSIRSIVCLAPTDPSEQGEPWLLDFADMAARTSRPRFGTGYSHFGIWSIRFSGDGREIVAGTSDNSVYVYDIESRKSILSIPGHNDDVNAVCFGDAQSPHILYSGSDDTLIKVWDRRSMSDKREAGVFMGHTEGLTYVDSKGDGRYVLSNGKDQTMKLWDLRKMMPTEKASNLDPAKYTLGFDYRFMTYSDHEYKPHPHDCSLVTYRGHSVLKTLIRCHFSPPGSTNSRYVYSGSEDGSIYVYNMDATLAGKIDVEKATHHSRPRDPNPSTNTYEMDDGSRGAWKTCVRDASWHPNAPVIAATSWNGWGMSKGTCTTHSWNDGANDDEGEPKMGLRVDQQLKHDDGLYNNPRVRSGRTSQFRNQMMAQRVPAADEDVDEEPW